MRLRTVHSGASRLGVTCLALALLSGLLIVFGLGVDWPHERVAMRAALLELGGLGLILSAAPLPLLWLRDEQRRAVLGAVRTFVTAATISLLAMFACGELTLRWIYRDGMSFSSHYGPLVQRFEQNFRFNHFDGPSRGPEVAGPKVPGELRVLFQGDSITWGQGVKDETLLYTNRLLAQLRERNPGFMAAALAQPGLEIDTHLDQLLKWGDKIGPDLIIYQWYINDIELDKSRRPEKKRHLWPQLYIHNLLTQHSYLWFFLDYVLGVKLLGDGHSYVDYISTQYGVSSDAWAKFTQVFHAWSASARRLTPHVIVMLVPFLENGIELAEFHDRLIELCREDGIVALDLIPSFDVFKDDYSQTYATPFDGHPNALVHERMAQALYHTIEVTWPELVREPSQVAGPPSAYSH